MLHTDRTLTCPDCAAQLTLTPDHEDHAGPCYQKGPRRCPSCGQTHKAECCRVHAGIMTWVISEDKLGFIRPSGDSTGDIASVFAEDGALLAEAAPARPKLQAVPLERVGRVQRLLRYYFGRGGRRVVLLDGHGWRWLGRITGTRWHPNGRVWFILKCPETAAA